MNSAARVALFSALALAWAAPAPAQIETVRVTAARLPDPVGGAAFSVTNMTSDQLAQFDQLDTALEQVPGLSLFRRSTSLNSNATTEGISLREIAPSGAGRALVMLDGGAGERSLRRLGDLERVAPRGHRRRAGDTRRGRGGPTARAR